MARRKTVAFFTNDTGQGADYQGTLKLGLEQACAEGGFDLFVYAGRSSWTRTSAQRQIYELIDPRRIDGIVLASGCIASYAPLAEVIERIRRLCPVPTCSVGQSSGTIPSILVDNLSGVTKIVDHLVRDHGRRQIAYIAGPEEHEESEQRLRGTRAALARFGIELRSDAIIAGDFSTSSGREAVRLLLERKIPFDAIIAASDDMALGALEVLRNGADTTGAIAVAGFDDAPGAWMSEPPLTTVRQPMAEIGALAIAHLVAMWEGHEVPRELTIGTELVVRESCGCRPTETRCGDGRLGGSSAADRRGPDLANLLSPLVGSGEQCAHWRGELIRAVEAQQAGEDGALLAALDAFVRRTSGTHVPIHELQRVITSLRASTMLGGSPSRMEGAFHAARAQVGSHAYRRVAQELLRTNAVLMEMRSGWEQLATSLTLPGLQRALASELPRLGVQHGLVALYPEAGGKQLVPLLYLEDGVAMTLPDHPYPSGLLFPDGAFLSSGRRTLTVLPLTFENQQLGVAVLELPHRLRIYELLREQIGSAIKTVQLHQQFIAEERRHAQAQEEKRATVERLRSVSLIAGGVAHDLNNVLGPLVALPEAIQRELRRAGTGSVAALVEEDLEMIRQAAQRAAHTIGDLLALGRGNEVPTTTLDLSQLIENERRNFTAICESKANVSLVLRVPSKPLVVQASKPHMIRAVTNLVINAVDAIQKGQGSVEVRVFEAAADAHLSDLPFGADRYAVIEVEDDGVGIAEENLPRILEPFFSSKRHTGRVGNGLGLAIVNRIVQDSLGTMRVKTQAGHGSTFSIYLPLLEQSACTTSLPPAVVGGHERILVVDDELVQLRTARRSLEHLGYRVEAAQTPEEALAIFSRDPAFDLVIADMIMPGGTNGIEMVAMLRALRPEQKALIASGFAPAKLDAQAAEQGLIWLPKPYSLASLDSAVRAALAGCVEWST